MEPTPTGGPSRCARWPSAPLGLLLAALLAACGGGDICLDCNPSGSPTPTSSVRVTGNISRLSTFNPFSDVTVIVCVDLQEGQSVADCQKIFLTDAFSDGTFSRSGVDPGSEAIFFWIDENDDGTIDPDDPIARLQDPERLLDLVEAGFTVSVANAVVNFTTEEALATITVSASPTPTPTPSGSPTPTPKPTRTP